MRYIVLRPEQIIEVLERNGFCFVKQRGSHRKYKKDNRTVIVQMHYKLAKGTFISILEQAGLIIEQII